LSRSIALILGLVLALSIFLVGNVAYGWQFAAVGDITNKGVISAVKANNPEVIVLLGDYYGKESTFVKGFVSSTIPVLAACGNHDDCKKVAANDNIKGDSVTYGFRHKGVAFLILNTEESISSQKVRAEGLFKKWQADPAIFSIVSAQHIGAITTSSAHHKESEAKGYRAFFEDMAVKYPKFDMLLQGHNHGYQVCEPVTPDITVITEGTGGRSPYPWGSARDDNCNTNLSGSKYTGFTLLNVAPNYGITFGHKNII
jgi:predicted phosphodiesterase